MTETNLVTNLTNNATRINIGSAEPVILERVVTEVVEKEIPLDAAAAKALAIRDSISSLTAFGSVALVIGGLGWLFNKVINTSVSVTEKD